MLGALVDVIVVVSSFVILLVTMLVLPNKSQSKCEWCHSSEVSEAGNRLPKLRSGMPVLQ